MSRGQQQLINLSALSVYLSVTLCAFVVFFFFALPMYCNFCRILLCILLILSPFCSLFLLADIYFVFAILAIIKVITVNRCAMNAQIIYSAKKKNKYFVILFFCYLNACFILFDCILSTLWSNQIERNLQN